MNTEEENKQELKDWAKDFEQEIIDRTLSALSYKKDLPKQIKREIIDNMLANAFIAIEKELKK